jgi:hypothetical protein
MEMILPGNAASSAALPRLGSSQYIADDIDITRNYVVTQQMLSIP